MPRQQQRDPAAHARADSQTGITFADLEHWLTEQIADHQAHIVLAMARGAVRLIQLHCSTELLKRARFMSHHALPFLPPSDLQGKNVLLFDDSVIFGSMMDEVRQQLVARGAIVRCASYCVDRTHFYGERPANSSHVSGPSLHSRTISLYSPHRLWPAQMRQHHALLVQSILQSPLNYNLDFPTFEIHLAPFQSRDVPYLAQRLSGASDIRLIRNVSSPASIEAGLPRYSALLREPADATRIAVGVSRRPYSKLRLTFDPPRSRILVTPIFQLAIRDDVTTDNIGFLDRTLGEVWRRLVPPTCADAEDRSGSALRLLTAITGVSTGAAIVRRIADYLANYWQVGSLIFQSEETRWVLGRDNESILEGMWTAGRGVQCADATNDESAVAGPLSDDDAGSSALCVKLTEICEQYPQLRPTCGDLGIESVGKILLALRQVSDSDLERLKNPSASRLKVGVTFSTIRQFLKRWGVTLEADDVSLIVDSLVDRGLAVPKIIHSGQSWLRAFSFGEDEEDQPTLQFRTAIHDAYKQYLVRNPKKPLSMFDMHKLCVCLTTVLPWVPITVVPAQYGNVSSLGVFDARNTDWLISGTMAPFEEYRQGKKKVLRSNTRYTSLVRSSWSAHERRDFRDAFDYMAKAFSAIRSSGPKLLASTCRTQRSFFRAVAFEAHSWAGPDGVSFGDALRVIIGKVRDGKDGSEVPVDALFWPIVFVTEAGKKERVFYQESRDCQESLRRAFVAQGVQAGRWWEFALESGLIDHSSDPEIELRWKYLKPLLEQMRRLTLHVCGILIDARVTNLPALQAAITDHGRAASGDEFEWLQSGSWETAARDYDSAVQSGDLPGLAIFGSSLVSDVTSIASPRERLVKQLSVALDCANEVSRATREYCKKYQGEDGAPEYAPNATHRRLASGDYEEIRENVYLLALDIIKGTNSPQTNAMKDRIRSVLRGFGKSHGVITEETGNDAFIACAADPLVLWAAAESIWLEGENLRRPGERFGGTRKSLLFGSVSVIHTVSGKTLIQDCHIPNDVPRAFYMLPGIEESVADDVANGYMIVEKATMERCRELLKLERCEERDVMVRAKHFNGPCCLMRAWS